MSESGLAQLLSLLSLYQLDTEFSIPFLTRLASTSWSLRKQLQPLINDFKSDLNIYSWSRAHTAFLTTWGRALDWISCVCPHLEGAGKSRVARITLSECLCEHDLFYEWLLLNEIEYQCIIGKESGEEERVACPPTIVPKAY